MGSRRAASHAGTWYSDDEKRLSLQLDGWLDRVPECARGIGPVTAASDPAQLPSDGARVIIAPHAGYAYSGPAAAWAYKSLDLSQAKRVFILGPSHHFYLTGCALSQCQTYETPFGDLVLDEQTIAELHATGKFDRMSQSVDEEEHSIEMHLPYTYKLLSRAFSDDVDDLPPIVPILVGNTSAASEQEYGALLAPYLADPTSVFIVSSDFAHWGSRFRYTYYQPASGPAVSLRSGDRSPKDPLVHESIAQVDMMCMGAIEGGSHDDFLDVLAETQNTVCGRHPIGVVMAALEHLKAQGTLGSGKGQFKFVRYERSSDCLSAKDSSVSYCSGFAVL